MISALFGVLADIFPGLIFVTIVAGLVLLGRVWSRMSSGSAGAGSPLIEEPLQLGLQPVPWELHGIAESLRSGSSQPIELIARRAEDLGIPVSVPASPSVQYQIDSLLDQIEAALDLPPLPEPPPQGNL